MRNVSVEFTDKELSYLLAALKKYEGALLATDSEEMGDAVGDLICIQALVARVMALKAVPRCFRKDFAGPDIRSAVTWRCATLR